jgi:hypothetical protein
MILPRDADVLAEFNETPALALVRRNGSVFLLAGFDVLQSNWPFEPGFVLFCYNAAGFLGTQLAGNQEMNLKVSEPIVVEGLDGQITAQIDGPDFSGKEISSSVSGSLRFPGTDRAGTYSLSIDGQPAKFFAVNLLDLIESNIEPRRQIVLSGQPVQAEEYDLSRANLPMWPFLVGLALVLLCLEWIIYNRKVRI